MKYTLRYSGKIVTTYDSFDEATRGVEREVEEFVLDEYSLDREDGAECELSASLSVFIEEPEEET